MHCNGGTAVNAGQFVIKEEPMTPDQENSFESHHSRDAALPTHSHYLPASNAESGPSLRGDLYTCNVCGYKCGRQFDLKKHLSTHSGRPRKRVKVRSTNFSKWERSLLVRIANEHTAVLENKRTDNASNTAKMRCWEKIAQQFNTADLGPSREPKVLKAKYEGIKKELRRMSLNGPWKAVKGAPREMSPPPIPEEEKHLRDVILTSSGGSGAVEGADSDSGCFAVTSPLKNDQEINCDDVELAMEEDWSKVPTDPLHATKADELPIPTVLGVEDDVVSSSGDTVSPTAASDLKVVAPYAPQRSLEDVSKRRRPVTNPHSSPASTKFEILALRRRRLIKKRELLLDLKIEAARKQCECFDAQIKYYKMLENSK